MNLPGVIKSKKSNSEVVREKRHLVIRWRRMETICIEKRKVGLSNIPIIFRLDYNNCGLEKINRSNTIVPKKLTHCLEKFHVILLAGIIRDGSRFFLFTTGILALAAIIICCLGATTIVNTNSARCRAIKCFPHYQEK